MRRLRLQSKLCGLIVVPLFLQQIRSLSPKEQSRSASRIRFAYSAVRASCLVRLNYQPGSGTLKIVGYYARVLHYRQLRVRISGSM